jgi:hypothetical protein
MILRRHVHITGGIEDDSEPLRHHMMRSHDGDHYERNAGTHRLDHAYDRFAWWGLSNTLNGTEDEPALD